MDKFISAIKRCLDAQNWLGALFIALAMPDICGNIAYPELSGKRNVGKRYRKWVTNYLSPYLTHKYGDSFIMTACDCYDLRCALLHEGVTSNYRFVIKDFHFVQMGQLIMVNITIFCEDMIRAVAQWDKAIKNNKEAQERIGILVPILQGILIPGTLQISINPTIG